MIKKLLSILLILFLADSSIGQNIPIGDWRDHLPYSDAVSVSFGNDIIYCATNSAVFIYDQTDNTIERLNLVNGLSDIGLSKIKLNPFNNKLIIAYANGNLDVIDDNNNITNLSFIKNSSIVGSKTINHIYLQGKLAYLSTGFGIVVLDTDKLEIVDTYLFGPLGSYVVTNAVTMDSLSIYAATEQGVFYAPKNSTNLIDYNVWTLLPELGTLNYGSIVTFSNRVFAFSQNTGWLSDSIYYNNNGTWQKFLPNGYNVVGLNVANNNFFIIYESSIEKFDLLLTKTNTVYTYQGLFNIRPYETTMDNDGWMLIAEESHGILRVKDNWNGEIISPNSPSSSNVFRMDFLNNELWVVSGGYSLGTSKNIFNHKQPNGDWEVFDEVINNASGNPTADMVCVLINPQNANHVYMGSFNDGLFELNNGTINNIYNAQNSILDSTFFGSTAIASMAMDKNNNLWVSSSFSNNVLAVKTASNNWYSYSFLGYTAPTEYFPDMIIDDNNYKWLISPEANRILIFDDNNSIENNSDDRVILNNNIPGSRIECITLDSDGEVWIGTDEGIAVFYNPSNVFEENIKAERIYIQQDGQTQILLETEVVTAIAIDGANRKWIGTQNSGVYLMSEDGAKQIEHFTTDNSPLFSNTIFDIVINQKTGEVYFGTEKGLISYKGTATEGNEDFSNIFVYPNPVKPDFNGTIAIRGLVNDTDVRITDISGNIVYQTISLGGQAIWDGKDFNGNKVQTGVYMIFNGSPEGELKAAAKILFIN